jgi:ATP-dependent protease HslVU (ClpYQ) ATPase subunit
MEGIAKEAETEETGARGLMTVCERIFREYKYQLPDHDVKEFIVGQEMTENPIEKLKSLLEDPTQYRSKVVEFQLGKIEQELSDRYGIEIAFTPEASQLIAEKAKEMDTDLLSYSADLLKEFEHGLNLLRKNSKKKKFLIDEDFVLNPADTVERWIRETYQ